MCVYVAGGGGRREGGGGGGVETGNERGGLSK